ncbi:hypothetical protein I3842_13G134200 [Carya illinoinensis]|uniref:Uncharacterized protein n=1 Tax=Carya illinoinensis TaxID=32201 RepID=A0A922DDT1_CARIL|nr:hypothetical protein I3842_13G134200 [Carya illinoinensis]
MDANARAKNQVQFPAGSVIYLQILSSLSHARCKNLRSGTLAWSKKVTSTRLPYSSSIFVTLYVH